MEFIFCGQLNSQSVDVAPERDIRCGWMFTATWRQFSVPLEMAPIIAFVAFLIMVLTTSKSGATERNFIVRLTTFNFLDIRLSLDCELPIRTF